MGSLDPQIAALAGAVPDLGGEDHRATRAQYRALFDAAPPVAIPVGLDVTEHMAPGPEGAPEVRVRLYRPAGEDPVPALVYFHGGGFYVGDLEFAHAACLQYASEAGCAVVSVDYRLAPEHPFPAARDDGYAALRWTAAHADRLGIDGTRLGVGGSSAGGGLAASVALLARDRGGPELMFQLLAYPVLDDRVDTPSARRFADTPILNRRGLERCWELYLDGHRGDPPPTAAPARAEDLRGLPPAYVMAAELDPLRDEDVAYALRLQEAGVPTELHVIPGVPHGFVVARNAPVTRRVHAEHVAVLRAGLA